MQAAAAVRSPRPRVASGPQWPRILLTQRTTPSRLARRTRRIVIMHPLLFWLTAFSTIIISFAQEYEVGERCTTPAGVEGACINIRGCPPLLELLRTQRQRPGAADFLRRSVCRYENFDPVVCCPGFAPPTPSPDIPATPPPSRTQRPSPPPPTSAPNAGPLPSPHECGFSNASQTRVVNGVEAKIGAWPWMVALAYQPRGNSKEPRFLCGASLISNRHVLTAAHCVYNRKDLYFARLGEHDLKSDVNDSAPIDIPIAERRVHEKYSPSAFTNDIAILVLEKSITPTLRVHPICLPLTPELRTRNYVKTRPFVAGWGSVRFSGPSSATLQEVQIPVVTEEQCKQSYASFKSAVIDERVLCAGYQSGGKDACQGDSGGPLMAPLPGPSMTPDDIVFYQIGVVSFGYRCAEPDKPGVYTHTGYFLDWILENVK